MSFTPRLSGNFQEQALQFIRAGEGPGPYLYGDPIGVPTIGYGYALVVKDTKGIWALKSTLVSDLSAIGIALTAAQQNILSDIASALNNGKAELADSLSDGLGDQIGAGDVRPITEAESRVL